MSDEASELQKRIQARFPRMQPIQSAPSLGTFNGIGPCMYGKRDFDEETRSYIKTRWFCVVFLPLIAIDAYRVVDADDRQSSWYFLGKVPLPDFARGWNRVVLVLGLALVATVGVTVYMSTPEYAARTELRRADRLLKAGDCSKAANVYHKVAAGPHYTDEARKGLQSALERCLQSESPGVVASAFRLLARTSATSGQPAPVASAFERGLQLTEQFGARNPENGLVILDAVATLAPTNSALVPVRTGLLVRAIAANPDNTNRVTELALLYEATDRVAESVKLLSPYRERLGATEGARILGHDLLAQGKHDEAYRLLYPYVHVRMGDLKGCGDAYSNAVQTVYEKALNDLRAGRADAGFYKNYEKASKTAQGEMVDRFIQKRVASDPGCNRILEQMKDLSRIVVVALDLGFVQLSRAQGMTDPAARKAELEAAEKTFLSIRCFAEESDEYRLFLGQVYYWLGRFEAGRELFDQLLKSRGRSYLILMQLASTLREVGDHPQSRILVEEAYEASKTDAERFAAAALRVLLRKDDDDEIAWLAKCNPDNITTQIDLNKARGRKATREGNKEQAARFLRAALTAYEGLPRTSATLNNWGLGCFDLYAVTGNIGDYNRGMNLLSEAISLEPGNSILIANTMHVLQSQAVMDMVRDRLRVDLLKRSPYLGMLSHLFDNEEERNRMYAKLAQNESMVRSLALLDKALLLAPKDVNLYGTAVDVYRSFRNVDELRKLKQRFTAAGIDMSERIAEHRQVLDGTRDKDLAEKCGQMIRELESLTQLPAVREHPATLSYVTYSLLENRLIGQIYGVPCKTDELLAAAKALYEKTSSTVSSSALVAMYFQKADEELSAQVPEYAAVSKQTRRNLSTHDRVAFLLEKNDALGRALLKNENVQKALELQKVHVRKFPSFPSATDWALFRNVDPALASTIAANLKTNEVAQLSNLLEWQLSPVSGQSLLSRYWFLRAVGDEPGAADVMREGIKNGAQLPVVPDKSGP